MGTIGQKNLINTIKNTQPEPERTYRRSEIIKRLDKSIAIFWAVAISALMVKILAEFCVEQMVK